MLRQARRLAKTSRNDLQLSSNEDLTENEIAPHQRKQVFAGFDDDSSSSSSDSLVESDESETDDQLNLLPPDINSQKVDNAAQKVDSSSVLEGEVDDFDWHEELDVVDPLQPNEKPSASTKRRAAPRGGFTLLLCEKTAFDVSAEALRALGPERTRGTGGSTRRSWQDSLRAKKMWLYSGEQNWPVNFDAGLSMDLAPVCDSQCGHPVFTFSVTSKQAKSEREIADFLRSERGFIPRDRRGRREDALQKMLQKQPLNAITNIVFADLIMQQSDIEAASAFIERAVYTMQCSLHPRFSPFILDAQGCPQVVCIAPGVDPRRTKIDRHMTFFYKSLLLYVHLLEHRGQYRASLEVSKLLLASHPGIDVTHSLLRMAHQAVTARCFDFLLHLNRSFVPQLRAVGLLETKEVVGEEESDNELSSVRRRRGAAAQQERSVDDLSSTCMLPQVIDDLDLMMPNFAFATAIALHLSQSKPLSLVALQSLRAKQFCRHPAPALSLIDSAGVESSSRMQRNQSGAADNTHHTALLRALLLFPHVLGRMLSHLSCTATESVPGSLFPSMIWRKILFAEPFSTATRISAVHSQHGDVIQSKLGVIVASQSSMWKSGTHLAWLHTAAAQLVALYSTSEEDRIVMDNYRSAWTKCEFALDLTRLYEDVREQEFSSSGSRICMPSFILHSTEFQRDDELTTTPEEMPDEAAVARQNREIEDDQMLFVDPVQVQNLGQLLANSNTPTVSLFSDPWIVFFETLLPWKEIDLNGLFAEPTKIDCRRRLKNVVRSVYNLCGLSRLLRDVQTS
eukprot:Lankesteria_metandrocarpae@DN4493_c0_g1_i1.p1